MVTTLDNVRGPRYTNDVARCVGNESEPREFLCYHGARGSRVKALCE